MNAKKKFSPNARDTLIYRCFDIIEYYVLPGREQQLYFVTVRAAYVELAVTETIGPESKCTPRQRLVMPF
jgi:hypothetical protein